MKKKVEIRLIFLIGAALLLAACSPTTAAPEAEEPATGSEAADSGSSETETQPTAVDDYGYTAPESGGAISLTGSDPCSFLTQEQVDAAFGKEVVEVNPDTQAIGSGCEYVFDADTDTQLQISIYEGDPAKHYLAGLVAASQESCDAFYDKLFDIAFGQSPDSGQDVSGLSMADLYRQYLGIFDNCPSFIRMTDRTDVGENVLATELMVFNWSSSVAVLGSDRVVEFTYQEPISDEAQAAFQDANDKDSFYAAAQPYADSVLAGYTEVLIGLLHEATMQ